MRLIRWYPVLGAIALLALAFPVQAEPLLNRVLTLDDIIKIAFSRNPGLNAARRHVEASDFGRKISRGLRLGRGEIFAENLYAGFDDVNEKRLIPRTFLFPSRVADDVFGRNTISTGISYRIPIYTGGRMKAQVETSELAALVSRHQLQQTGDDLILNLSGTFYTLLRLAGDIQATEASLRTLEESKRVVAEVVRVGQRPRVDLLKVNTRAASIHQELIRRRNTEAVTHGALAALMGLEDVTQRFQLAGPLSYTPEPVNLHESIQEALERHPAYQSAKEKVAIATRQVQVAQSRRLPQVSMAFVFRGATNDNDMTRVQDDFTASLLLRVPFFTGGVLTGQASEAKARLAQAEERLREVRLSISREVQEAFFRLKNAEERIVAAQAALEEASEALRIEQLKLDVGKGTTKVTFQGVSETPRIGHLELNDGRGAIEGLLIAQSEELEARTNSFSALADVNIARMALRKAVGVVRPIRPLDER